MNPTTVYELPTPALVIDLPVVERNLARMAEYCREHKIGLRPHGKTHKSIQFGRMQIERGAIGLTVAKAGEAEVMAEATNDLLVAYSTVDPARSARLAELAKRAQLRVAIDSTLAADSLDAAAGAHASTIGILVDLDVGYHRTGVQTIEAAVALARHVSARKHLRFDGLMCYPGHVVTRSSEQAAALTAISKMLDHAIAELKRSGLQCRIVSGGSTPTAFNSHLVPQLTEIRPGTYIFNDWNTASGAWCSLEDCAARVLCTVVSDAVPGKVVIDAGSKTLTSDRLMTDPQNGGFGRMVDYHAARVVRLTEEHGEIDLTGCATRPKLGQRVWLIPNHICPCVNLQDFAWVRDADGAIEPLRIDARGKLV
jgi:D-serine deaminase-like pyridoxal phosphate-dependent protein